MRSVHLSAPCASSCCLPHKQTQHSASGAPSASLWSSLIPHIIVFFTGSGCFTFPRVPKWLAHFWEMTVPLLGLLPCTEIQKASTKKLRLAVSSLPQEHSQLLYLICFSIWFCEVSPLPALLCQEQKSLHKIQMTVTSEAYILMTGKR